MTKEGYISGFDERVISAKICPYCGRKPKYVDSSIVYGKSYGMIYFCGDCDAYVGVHYGNSGKPLGRLANRELRSAKKEAHFYFDHLWKRATKKGRSKSDARSAAYKWLGENLNIPKEHTHIGMFDVDMCKRVVEICKPYCKDLIE